MRTIQSQFVITTLKRLSLAQAAKMFVQQSEPKVHELVDQLVNDPEPDHLPILRTWARAYPDYAEAVQWIVDNLDVAKVVEILRTEVQQRNRKP